MRRRDFITLVSGVGASIAFSAVLMLAIIQLAHRRNSILSSVFGPLARLD